MEQWKAIEGEPGYEVSDQGRVRWLGGSRQWARGTRDWPPRIELMRQSRGYLSVWFPQSEGRKQRRVKVHRLVAFAFLSPPLPGHNQVNHKNGNKLDNRAENLEWVTQTQNARHSVDTLGNNVGHKNPAARLTEAQVVAIRADTRPQSAIAADYSIPQQHVSAIKLRQCWRHI